MATNDELITFGQAAERAGFDRRTVFSRIQEAGITVFQDGVDRRRRLIRLADLPRLTAPRPTPRRKTTAMDGPQ